MKKTLLKWLRNSEQYTKTDMVYLIGQSGWLLIGQGIIFTSSFLLAWIFANFVEPADYGLYKYVLSIATIATITTVTGLSIALARAVSQGHSVSLPKLLRIRILFGLLGTAGLFALAAYYLLVRDNTLLATLFAVTALWIPFYETFSDYQYVLQGKRDFKTQTYLRIIQRFTLTGLVILTIVLTRNIIIITLVFFAASTFSQYLAFRYTIRKYPTLDDSQTPYKEIIDYGKHTSLQNIFLIGVGQFDKILMFKLLGPSQLAVYFFAIAIPQELQGILGNINSVAFPKLVNKESREFKKALLKKIALFSGLLIIPAILYIVAAPYLFTWFFPVYLESILISQLYVGTILFIPASLLWHYFYAVDNKKALWYGTFIGPSSVILGILIFVPFLGLFGAVLAIYLRAVLDLAIGLYFFWQKKTGS